MLSRASGLEDADVLQGPQEYGAGLSKGFRTSGVHCACHKLFDSGQRNLWLPGAECWRNQRAHGKKRQAMRQRPLDMNHVELCCRGGVAVAAEEESVGDTAIVHRQKSIAQHPYEFTSSCL